MCGYSAGALNESHLPPPIVLCEQCVHSFHGQPWFHAVRY